jgi:hypothetical protein
LGAGANATCEGDYEEKSVLHGMKDDRLRIMGEDKKGEWRMKPTKRRILVLFER